MFIQPNYIAFVAWWRGQIYTKTH